jgi:hypothetical protein
MPRLTCPEQWRVGSPDPNKTQITNTAGKPLGCTTATYSTFAVGQISCLIRNTARREPAMKVVRQNFSRKRIGPAPSPPEERWRRGLGRGGRLGPPPSPSPVRASRGREARRAPSRRAEARTTNGDESGTTDEHKKEEIFNREWTRMDAKAERTKERPTHVFFYRNERREHKLLVESRRVESPDSRSQLSALNSQLSPLCVLRILRFFAARCPSHSFHFAATLRQMLLVHPLDQVQQLALVRAGRSSRRVQVEDRRTGVAQRRGFIGARQKTVAMAGRTVLEASGGGHDHEGRQVFRHTPQTVSDP